MKAKLVRTKIMIECKIKEAIEDQRGMNGLIITALLVVFGVSATILSWDVIWPEIQGLIESIKGMLSGSSGGATGF